MVKGIVLQADGYVKIELNGHAKDATVCSAISAITDTYLLGLQAIQENYPNEISLQIKEIE